MLQNVNHLAKQALSENLNKITSYFEYLKLDLNAEKAEAKFKPCCSK